MKNLILIILLLVVFTSNAQLDSLIVERLSDTNLFIFEKHTYTDDECTVTFKDGTASLYKRYYGKTYLKNYKGRDVVLTEKEHTNINRAMNLILKIYQDSIIVAEKMVIEKLRRNTERHILNGKVN